MAVAMAMAVAVVWRGLRLARDFEVVNTQRQETPARPTLVRAEIAVDIVKWFRLFG